MDAHASSSPQAHLESEKPYAPHDVLDETAKTALVGLGGGFFLAAIRNAMSRRNVGAMGVFTRGAPIIGICGMLITLARLLACSPIGARVFSDRKSVV